MSEGPLAPCESVRLCFRSELPGRWTLGEETALKIALENEAGVRVRHPHSRGIWAEQDSASAREGSATGVPLRVTLEGERADRFLLDVAGCIQWRADGGGDEGAKRGLILDLSTGMASGSFTVLAASGAASSPPSETEEEEEGEGGAAVSSTSSSYSDANAQRQWPQMDADGNEPGQGQGRVEEGGQAGEGGEMHLAISLCPGWSGRFNRPVLPLESLPALVLPSSNPLPTTVAGLAHSTYNKSGVTGRSRDPLRPASQTTVVRNGSCSVRRLLFEVNNNQDYRKRQGRRRRRVEGAAGKNVSCSSSSTACKGQKLTTTATAFATAGMIEIRIAESIRLGGFFGTVWDCSLEMGAFLAGLGPGALRGKRVVELGAGCGAVSALCAALGASEVVATDTKDLLPLLTSNLERNRWQGSQNVKACQYDWGSPVRSQPLLAHGGFDVIICSDLLYDPVGWEPLLASLAMLTASGGLGQRQGAMLSSPAPAAAAVVYLAHRTRNAQERQFFYKLLGSSSAAAAAKPDLREGGDRRGGEGREGGAEEKREGNEPPLWRCRRLVPDCPQEEEEEKEVLVLGGTGNAEAAVQGEMKERTGRRTSVEGHASRARKEGLTTWKRGCFPDVAIYELSPVGPFVGCAHTNVA